MYSNLKLKETFQALFRAMVPQVEGMIVTEIV
jgi:hypothetical protein